jgi:antitoxin PrlF
MPTATLTSKGQITLPREVREHLHLSEGDRVEFLIDPEDGVRLRPMTRSVKELAGMLHQPGMRPLSIREMDKAIARFHIEENERILRGGLPENDE